MKFRILVIFAFKFLFNIKALAADECMSLHGAWRGICTTNDRSYEVNEVIVQVDCLIVRINGLSYRLESINSTTSLESDILGTSNSINYWFNMGTKLSILTSSIKRNQKGGRAKISFINYEMDGNRLSKSMGFREIDFLNGNVVETSFNGKCNFEKLK